MIERHHLQMIKAITDTGTVTAAADKLHVTQSALSHSIKKLESSLNTAIWRKSGRKLTLTTEGQKLLEAAERILPQFESVESELAALVQGKRGTIKAGIECYPCFQWLLKVVAPLLKDEPDVDIDIKNEFKFDGIQALLNHEVDLLITPDKTQHNELSFIPVFDYEQVLVVSTQDELSTRTYVLPEQLGHKTLYTYPIDKSRLDIFGLFLLPAGCDVAHHKTLENTEMILEMVKHHRGVAALPKWLIEETDNSNLACIKLGQKGIKKSTYIAVRSEAELPPLTQLFIDQALAFNSQT